MIAARCGLEHTCSRPILSWMELWARPMRQKMPPKMTAEDTLLIARAMLVALSRLTWRLWWRMHDNLDHSLPSGIVVFMLQHCPRCTGQPIAETMASYVPLQSTCGVCGLARIA